MTFEINFLSLQEHLQTAGRVECGSRGSHTASHVIRPILLHIQVKWMLFCVFQLTWNFHSQLNIC